MNKLSGNGSRRDLLKILGVGGLAANQVSVEWSSPVVQSVILPAHAQTTESTAPSADSCDNTIAIPGRTVLCTDEATDIYTLYAFSLTDGCLQVESTQSDSEPANGPDRFYIRVFMNPGIVAQIVVEPPNGGGADPQNFCTGVGVDFSFEFDFELEVGGQQVDVVMNLAQFTSPGVGVSASDITVTLA